MSSILQADENGVLHLPPSLLPGSAPRAAYKIDQLCGSLVVSKSSEISVSQKSLKPEERSAAFRGWVASLPPGPGLSDHAVSRDSIYD